MADDHENEVRGRVDTRDGERRSQHPESLVVSSQVDGGGDRSSGNTPAAPMDRNLPAWGVTLFIVAVWCISALGIGVNFAHSFWEWLPIFTFGLGVPAAVLWQANRLLASPPEPLALSSAKD